MSALGTRGACILGVVLLGLGAPETELLARGWVQEPGQGYYGVTARLTRSTRFFEPNGDEIDIPTIGDYSLDLYGEYGLSESLTGIIYLPFKRITLNEQIGRDTGTVFFPGDAATGVSDGEIGLRFGLVRGGPTVLSATFALGLPLGSDEQVNGLLTGTGELNQVFGLEVGHSTYPGPWYMTGSVAFNNRTDGYSDDVRYGAEVARRFDRSWIVALQLNGVSSTKNGDDATLGGMGGLFANDQSYLTFGPEVLYAIGPGWGAKAGIVGALYGENVLAAPQFSFGFTFDR